MPIRPIIFHRLQGLLGQIPDSRGRQNPIQALGDLSGIRKEPSEKRGRLPDVGKAGQPGRQTP
jgi:hypothetical protein